ncbi:hypothetical protein [Brucella intermedia]|uniref:hypothetical protein n=1 Tax=Brucella intermedia TaxID=94625 RepID=UPI002362B6B8|nr:hypothetical protein [Brucella intermedia]
MTTVPEEAVKAACAAINERGKGNNVTTGDIFAMVEAALPHLPGVGVKKLDLTVLERLADYAEQYDHPDENGPFPDIQDAMVTVGDLRQARKLLSTLSALELSAADMGNPITLTYTNYRGETSERTITPIRPWFGSTEWHSEPQWLLTAFDHEKQANRDFAIKDFGWPQPKVEKGDTFKGTVDGDTELQAAAREAGWALIELVDEIDWLKREQVSDIITRLGIALNEPSDEVDTIEVGIPATELSTASKMEVVAETGIPATEPSAARELALEEGDLNARLKAKGMYSIDEMMGNLPIDKWRVHSGMTDLTFFGEWLERKSREYLTMKAAYDVGDKDESDELYEWVLAHYGAFHDVLVNFRAALSSPDHADAGKVEGDGWTVEYEVYSGDEWQAASTDLDGALDYAFMYAADGFKNITVQEVRRRTLPSAPSQEVAGS